MLSFATQTHTRTHAQMYNVTHTHVRIYKSQWRGVMIALHSHSLFYLLLTFYCVDFIFAGVVVVDFKRRHIFVCVAPLLQNNILTLSAWNVGNMVFICQLFVGK